jgi:DNA-binding NtrC family response regulator
LAHPDSARVGEVALLESRAELSRLSPGFATPDGGERHALLDRCLSRKPVLLELDANNIVIDPTGTSITVEIDGVAAPGRTLVEVDRLVAATPLVGTPAPRRSYRKAAEVSEDELLAALRTNDFRLGPTAKTLNVSRTRLYALVETSDKVRTATELSAEGIQSALAAAGGDLSKAARDLEVSAHALKIRMNALGL